MKIGLDNTRIRRDPESSYTCELSEGGVLCHTAKNRSRRKSPWNFRSQRQRPSSTSSWPLNVSAKRNPLERLFASAVALAILINSSTASASTEASPVLNPANAANSIIGEAEAEPMLGKIAIGEAIRNKGNLQGVFGVFSKRILIASPQVRKACEKAWALSSTTNLIRGATVWGTASDVKKFKKTKWFKSYEFVRKIGRHFFFRLRKQRAASEARLADAPETRATTAVSSSKDVAKEAVRRRTFSKSFSAPAGSPK